MMIAYSHKHVHVSSMKRTSIEPEMKLKQLLTQSGQGVVRSHHNKLREELLWISPYLCIVYCTANATYPQSCLQLSATWSLLEEARTMSQ